MYYLQWRGVGHVCVRMLSKADSKVYKFRGELEEAAVLVLSTCAAFKFVTKIFDRLLLQLMKSSPINPQQAA